MLLPFSGFLFCALLIFFSGNRLSRHGHRIAELTGMGKAWFGLILMASVTSLPELFVGISSSAIVQSADLATGDVLGSCVFNLAILSLLDALSKQKNIFSVAAQSHVLAGALGIILLSLVGAGLFLPQKFSLFDVALLSLIFIAVYFFSVRLVYKFERNFLTAVKETLKEEPREAKQLKKAILQYALHAVIVVAAAFFLPYFAGKISEETGLGKSFIGTLFLAASTSLPEVAVSVSAIRMGSVDIAVGNLFGSNLFNILILALDDFFYTKGDLLKHASDNNIVSVFSTIIMTAIAIAGLTYRAKEKKFLLAWDTLLILIVYIINMVILYQLS